ncbi:MAG: hypothetical protein J5992_09330 [Oscillospiraceae bacterium]|nr:hypothetical protein [Oscillospiraceae bacterium]
MKENEKGKVKWLKPKKAKEIEYIVIAITIGLSFIPLIFLEYSHENRWILWAIYPVCIVAAVGMAIFDYIFYVCPHCGEYLKKNPGNKCSFCGKDLNKTPYELKQEEKAMEERRKQREAAEE